MTSQPEHLTPNLAHEAPHLALSEAHSLQRIIERLVQAYRPRKIYLFGSKARNNAGPDSDFDLLVIVPDTAPRKQIDSRLAYEVLRGTGTAADVVVYTENPFQSRLSVAASLPATVMREGVLLYAA